MARSLTTHMDNEDRQSDDTLLCIAGANTFNNEVLSNFLKSQTGLQCHCIPKSNLPALTNQFGDRKILIFLDCSAMGEPPAGDRYPIDEDLQNQDCMVVCYNVDPGANWENAALKQGVRGIVYDHLPVEQYPRVALAVLDGELWYPREILERHLLAADPPAAVPDDKKPMLTRREREILSMLASGMRNQDIAKVLCISPHTVKTHAYNLYKKINVTNRFQAAQWLVDRR